MMTNRMLKNLVLTIGLVVCGDALAAPMRLSQNMMPVYTPAGVSNNYASFQPQYRYRPTLNPQRMPYRQPQYRYRSYAPPYPFSTPSYGFQQAGYQPYPPTNGNYPRRYAAAPVVPNPPAYGYYPRGAQPVYSMNYPQSRYPAPGYMGRYQYPQARYAWRPQSRYPQYPGSYAAPTSINPYGYAMRNMPPANYAQGYVPQPQYQQQMPTYYGRRSGLAYQFPPMPNRYPSAGYMTQPWSGFQQPAFNPYRYMPGQNLVARTLPPVFQRSMPVGRYMPQYGSMNRYLAGTPGGIYRFRPDPRFQQQAPAMQVQNTSTPSTGGFNAVSYQQSLPSQLNAEKFVWRPMDAVAENSLY